MIMMFLFELSRKINQFRVEALATTCYEQILALLYVLKDT